MFKFANCRRLPLRVHDFMESRDVPVSHGHSNRGERTSPLQEAKDIALTSARAGDVRDWREIRSLPAKT